MPQELTIIIPFKNEKEEIFHTLQSIQKFSEFLPIIVINDASDDGFDYTPLSQMPEITYICNPERIGVARCRDLGVEKCRTPYFLLLDAHMRFYETGWDRLLTEELKKEEKILLCCQTKALQIANQQLIESDKPCTYGARINFYASQECFDVNWIYDEKENGQPTESIPCVLGAGYACRKSYWEYLKGLQGLRYYGCDEAYISMKVWLEGGQCKLMKNIVIGHIYRETAPYPVDEEYIIYNKLFIAELLFPTSLKIRLINRIKDENPEAFRRVYQLLNQNKTEITELTGYYRKIFTRDFNFIEQMNYTPEQPQTLKKIKTFPDLKRKVCTLLLSHNNTSDISLFHGQMGLLILVLHYIKYTNDRSFETFAEELILRIFNTNKKYLPIDLGQGHCGIGWGFEYLIQNQLFNGDSSKILADMDYKIMERDPRRIRDFSLKNGLQGILHYVVARLISTHNHRLPCPFDKLYLAELNEIAHQMLLSSPDSQSTDIALKYTDGYKKGYWDYPPVQLSDILKFQDICISPQNENLPELDNGGLGMALKEIVFQPAIK